MVGPMLVQEGGPPASSVGDKAGKVAAGPTARCSQAGSGLGGDMQYSGHVDDELLIMWL